jgi:hypothetical protein
MLMSGSITGTIFKGMGVYDLNTIDHMIMGKECDTSVISEKRYQKEKTQYFYKTAPQNQLFFCANIIQKEIIHHRHHRFGGFNEVNKFLTVKYVNNSEIFTTV